MLTVIQIVKEFPHIWCKLKVHYRIHKIPPTVPVLNQINPVHDLPTNFFQINFNIIFLPTPRSSKWSTSFRFPHQNTVCICPLLRTCHMPCPSQSPSFDHRMFGERYKSWSPLSCDYFQSPVNSSLLSPNIFVSTCSCFRPRTPRSVHIYFSIYSCGWAVGPCRQGMARPQVADGGKASNVEGNCEYIE
jgi:hypothetical protein